MRLVDATIPTMTPTRRGLGGCDDYVLIAGYVGVTLLCVLMVFWIWYAPGSCTPLRNAMDQGWYREKSDAYVPSNLVTKYAKHFAVCATHVLPASGWCAIAPFQLHPMARKRFPRAHRVLGKVFFALGTSMVYGYWLIHRRGLHFHLTDFPTISQNDKMSLWIDYARLGGFTFVQFEHASAAWFFYTLSSLRRHRFPSKFHRTPNLGVATRRRRRHRGGATRPHRRPSRLIFPPSPSRVFSRRPGASKTNLCRFINTRRSSLCPLLRAVRASIIQRKN